MIYDLKSLLGFVTLAGIILDTSTVPNESPKTEEIPSPDFKAAVRVLCALLAAAAFAPVNAIVLLTTTEPAVTD